MFDYHVHSNFSADCDFSMEDIIKGAIHNNIKELCFTDHVDYDYCDPSIAFDIDFNQFDKTFFSLQKKYAHDINLKKGVEIGIQPHVIDKATKLVKSSEFDFVICSMHTCDKQDLYLGHFFENRTTHDIWEKYLEEVIYCATNFDHFSVFGHLDLPKRYHAETALADLIPYRDYFDKLFKILIEKGKGIEVNTSGFKNDFKQPLPSFEIIKWYKEAGGEIITLGSDSHTPDHPGYYFKETIKELKSIGFDYVCTFDKFVAEFQKI